jgi:hypothetical protein
MSEPELDQTVRFLRDTRNRIHEMTRRFDAGEDVPLEEQQQLHRDIAEAARIYDPELHDPLLSGDSDEDR